LNAANLTQDSARIAPLGVDVDWLHAALESPTVQRSIEERITGATVRGINIFDLRRVQLPTPTSDEQQRLGREAVAMRQAVAEARRLGQRSLALLTERKQALITAAVSGQFDVATARSVV
jgi:type I restriction enzyme, S subunit